MFYFTPWTIRIVPKYSRFKYISKLLLCFVHFVINDIFISDLHLNDADNDKEYTFISYGTHHHHTTAIFKFLSACGVDVVELKRSIAITLLKFRARAYRVMWTIASVPLPAPQRAPPVLALPPLLPQTLHLLLLIGQWTPVKCLSCVVLCMFCICKRVL